MRDLRKIGKKAAAVLLVTTMSVSLCACGASNDDKKTNDDTNKQVAEEITATGEGYGTKDETVYVTTDGAGAVSNVEVVNWLKNLDGVKSLKDVTLLENIINVKGNEEYNVANGEVTFETNGKDIYYQGTFDASALPITMEITYKLDGKEITADELVGKSGKLEMSVKFNSVKKVTINVDGEDKEVYVPFIAVTGAMLDTGVFSNVTIDHGKVVSNGQYQVAVGIGLAGVEENFNTKDIDMDVNEYTITADVTNYTSQYMMTFVTNSMLDDIDVSEANTLDDIFMNVTKLSNAANELLAGTDELATSVSKIVEASSGLVPAVQELNAASGKLTDASLEIATKSSALSTGLTKINGGVNEINTNMEKLVTGVNDLKTGTNTLYNGLKLMQTKLTAVQTELTNARTTYNQSVTANKDLIDTVNAAVASGTYTLAQVAASKGMTETALLTSIEQYYQAVGAVAALDTVIAKFTAKDPTTNLTLTQSVSALVTGGNTVNQSMATLYTKANQLYTEGTKVLLESTTTAANGASALAAGCAEYNGKMNEFNTGVSKLNDKVPTLVDTLALLEAGTNKLDEGMNQFVNEGINKIASLIDDGEEEEVKTLKAVIMAGSQYTSISGTADKQSSEVKFVIKTN